jgi:hypothetical protein
MLEVFARLMRRFRQPAWDGGPFPGRRLLVYNAQGPGDEIMFASCPPDLLRRGGECVAECLAKLQALFARALYAARRARAGGRSSSRSGGALAGATANLGAHAH